MRREGDDDTKVNKWRSVPLVDTCTEVITCVTSNHGLRLHLTPWTHSTPSTEYFCCHNCDQFLRQTICCVCFVCPSSQLPFHTSWCAVLGQCELSLCLNSFSSSPCLQHLGCCVAVCVSVFLRLVWGGRFGLVSVSVSKQTFVRRLSIT